MPNSYKKANELGHSKTILVTGFDRFGKFRTNPSEIIVRRLHKNPPKNQNLQTLILPTEFYRASRILLDAIEKLRPDYCLSLGVARGEHLRIERIGINVNNTDASDNAGTKPANEEICPGGPAAYWVTLPVLRIAEHLRASGIPAVVSYFAGTYVCNHVLYAALDYVHRNGLPTKVGFIHVPPIVPLANNKSKSRLRLSTLFRGVELALTLLSQTE